MTREQLAAVIDRADEAKRSAAGAAIRAVSLGQRTFSAADKLLLEAVADELSRISEHLAAIVDRLASSATTSHALTAERAS